MQGVVEALATKDMFLMLLPWPRDPGFHNTLLLEPELNWCTNEILELFGSVPLCTLIWLLGCGSVCTDRTCFGTQQCPSSIRHSNSVTFLAAARLLSSGASRQWHAFALDTTWRPASWASSSLIARCLQRKTTTTQRTHLRRLLRGACLQAIRGEH